MHSSVVLSVERLTIRPAAEGGTAAGRGGALRDVSFNISAGSFTALAGLNGSGKSTLAKAIAGLLAPSEGEIRLKEGASVGIVLQHPDTQLIGDTVMEEIALCAKCGDSLTEAEMRETAETVLRGAGLFVPPDTPVARLSGGEKQLLNVACCLAAQADIAVFDEAASMLDPASRERVLKAALAMCGKGTAVLWITHRMEELVRAHRVLALEQGRLVFDGTAAEFFYGRAAGLPSPCEKLGMEPPLVVQVVRQLEKKGVRLDAWPLLPEELGEAVKEYADLR